MTKINHDPEYDPRDVSEYLEKALAEFRKESVEIDKRINVVYQKFGFHPGETFEEFIEKERD